MKLLQDRNHCDVTFKICMHRILAHRYVYMYVYMYIKQVIKKTEVIEIVIVIDSRISNSNSNLLIFKGNSNSNILMVIYTCTLT